MSGHRHNSSAASQNQGNALGDRSCVRQSKLYRMYESGNDVKAILGSGHLTWDPNVKQGAYAGQKVYDHMGDNTTYEQVSDNYGRKNNVGGGRNQSNDENDYPPKNSLRNYAPKQENYAPARQESYAASHARSRAPYDTDESAVINYDNDYRQPKRNNVSGGSSSFLVGQSDYARRDEEEEEAPRNNNRRTFNEPVASNEDSYPLNKMSSRSGVDVENRERDSAGDDCYPLSKMRGDDNRTYRNMRDQITDHASASNFQPVRGKSSEFALERVGRNAAHVQTQDRSTRPW